MNMLTTSQAAAHLGITRSLVIRLCQQGRIKAQKFGPVWMIDEKELSKYKPNPKGYPKGKPRHADPQ